MRKTQSELKKEYWKNLRLDKEKYAQVCANIGKASKGRIHPKGEKSHGWKGGKYTTKRDGYVFIYCPKHPFAKKSGSGGGGYVLEHRLVMEKHLGRYLTKEEDVHHINGIKNDNRLENLKLVSHFNHYGELVCPHCGKVVITQ